MPAPARKPWPASEADPVIKHVFLHDVVQQHDVGLSPCAWNTIRKAISRDTSSSQHAGHAVRKNRTRSAAGTFSGHRQGQSEDLPPEVWLPSLSDDEQLVEEHAQSRGVEVWGGI
eukprot:scaffold3326_cov59-Phaeocystis_antarctica.AAC.2